MSRGIYFDKRRKKWIARCQRDGIRRQLGSFDTPEEAASAYLNHTSESMVNRVMKSYTTGQTERPRLDDGEEASLIPIIIMFAIIAVAVLFAIVNG